MSAREWSRRLRGAVGNAVVWGAGWGVLATLVLSVLWVLGVFPGLGLEGVLFNAVRVGIVGAAAGGAFSAAVGVLYRGRRLSDISWVRFGLGAGVVTGAFVPLLLQTMNLISGDGLVPWHLVVDDALWTAVFGAVVGGGTLRMAQSVEALGPGEETELLDP